MNILSRIVSVLILLVYTIACADIRKEEVRAIPDSLPIILSATELQKIRETGIRNALLEGVASSYLIKNKTILMDLYQSRNFNLIWMLDSSINEQGAILIAQLNDVEKKGLKKELYPIAQINILAGEIAQTPFKSKDKLYALEVLLSDVFFIYSLHLHKGMLDATYNVQYVLNAKDSILKNKLFAAADSGVDEGLFDSIQPHLLEYKNLIKSLTFLMERYDINETKVNVPDFKSDTLNFYIWLNEYLIRHQLADEKSNGSDSLMDLALKDFQSMHGLHEDGRIGSNTLSALAYSGRDRYRAVLVNLERMKKEVRNEATYIKINIPAFKFKLISDNIEVLAFKVIVGLKTSITPEIESHLEEVVVYPYWFVPYSIASKEILPEIRKNPGYLKSKNYQLFDSKRNSIDPQGVNWEKQSPENFSYFIRQDAGPFNALGLLKFRFPNNQSIYMHDTPAKKLFEKEVRIFSHGCVRLEKPFELARYLADNAYLSVPNDSVLKWVESKQNKHLKVQKNLPVYLRYHTAEASEKGEIFFYKDVYGRDDKYLKALFGD